MITKYKNAIIVTLNDNNDIFFNGDVVVKDNIILYAGQALSKIDESKLIGESQIDSIVDIEGNIIMPGFINAHSHIAMTNFRGLADGANFFDWFDKKIKPLEEKQTKEDIYNGAKLGILEMLSNGITSVYDLYFHSDQTIRAAQELGIRIGIGFGAVSGNEVINQDTLQNEYDYLKSFSNVIPFVYAHAPYSVDEHQFAELIRFARKNNLVLCTHASETLDEVGECDKRHGMTPIQLLESYGAFDGPCLLAHCVHVDKEDINILANYNVSVVSNPTANLKLGSGIAPVYAMLKAGVNVAVGTDGPASNNALDMFREMFLISTLQAGVLNDATLISAENALTMATRNGAKAMNIDNLGIIGEGMIADMVVINTHDHNMQPINNVVSNIVYSANPKNILMTIVDGKIVYKK